MKCIWVGGWTTDDSGQAALLKHAERYGFILNSLPYPVQLEAIRMVNVPIMCMEFWNCM